MSLALTFLAIASLQEPRPFTTIADSLPNLHGSPQLVATDNAILTVIRTLFADEVQVSASDGRGIEWSTPTTVGLAPTGATLTFTRVAGAGELAFIGWEDNRFHGGGSSSLPRNNAFLRSIDPQTLAVGAEILLPLPGPVSNSDTELLDLEVVQVGSEHHVHVLLRSFLSTDPLRSFVLASSHDGGQSFPFVHVLDEWILDTGVVDLVAEGATVHAFWRDPVLAGEPDRILHQRSSDGGVQLDFAQPQTLTTHPDSNVDGLVAATSGDSLVLGWVESEVTSFSPFDLLSQAWVSMSLDGGDSFSSGQLQLQKESPFERIFALDAFVDSLTGNGLFTYSSVNIDGLAGTVYVSRSVDEGVSWSWAMSGNHGSGFGESWIVGDRSDRGRVLSIQSFEDTFSSGTFFGTSFVFLSEDGGETFGSSIPLEGGPGIFGGAGKLVTGAVYDDRYQNLVATLKATSASTIEAGGFRPQTLTPHGFQAGSTQIQARFERFDSCSLGNCQGWLLLSFNAGDLTLPDGRNLGLQADPALTVSLDLASLGIFSTPLDSTGFGETPPFSASLPAGLQLFAVGLVLDASSATIGDLSDVISIQL